MTESCGHDLIGHMNKSSEHPDEVEAGLEKGTDKIPSPSVMDVIREILNGKFRKIVEGGKTPQPTSEAIARTKSDLDMQIMRGF